MFLLDNMIDDLQHNFFIHCKREFNAQLNLPFEANFSCIVMWWSFDKPTYNWIVAILLLERVVPWLSSITFDLVVCTWSKNWCHS